MDSKNPIKITKKLYNAMWNIAKILQDFREIKKICSQKLFKESVKYPRKKILPFSVITIFSTSLVGHQCKSWSPIGSQWGRKGWRLSRSRDWWSNLLQSVPFILEPSVQNWYANDNNKRYIMKLFVHLTINFENVPFFHLDIWQLVSEGSGTHFSTPLV